ncbi:MAG: cell division protein FtsL [Smithellaceae bacterium]
MAQSAGTHILPGVRDARSSSLGSKYSSFIVVAVLLMLVALIYVGSHIRMTQLEYEIAAALHMKERMLEDQKKLKLEFATLKAPQRIEAIAMKKLQMVYPDQGQVIVLKATEK